MDQRTMTDKGPPKSRMRQQLGLTLVLAYGSIVLLATMWPTPLDQGYAASINRVLDVLHRNGVPEWFGYNKLEASANILMFVPLGFLVSMLLPVRVWWLALIICPGLSVAIELTQAFALSARFATVSDVIANSTGAIIGAVLAVILRAAIYQRDEKIIARRIWELGLSR
ncbi:VanZ family protein [Cryobacterium sp. 1639]|uniref:VanZ family protein n=1 Tax=Cryobacterium inferilacus TaxID=2866629 RepID=UPI001C73473E|nr:VanZ family protein [Cryobacterium sp. 1639]MBX0300982.1 VanZ family protein [Cryobacterium sp. 1639]